MLRLKPWHYRDYGDVIMVAIASQITSLTIVYSTVYSDVDQRKSSASLAFARGIHRGPVNSPHKWPVTRKMFPFDDVIMITRLSYDVSCMSTVPLLTVINSSPLVPHICTSELSSTSSGMQPSRRQAITWTNAIFFFVNLTLRSKLHWNSNQNTKLFIHVSASKCYFVQGEMS